MNLDESRHIINETDREMARLFCRRMEASREIARYKKEQALPIEDPIREHQLLEANLAFVESEELKPYYIDFLRHTMAVSKHFQANLMEGIKVAYCGVEGAFAHIAAMKLFPGAVYVGYPSFEDAYKSVEDAVCDTCVLPIENSFAGDVGNVMDLVFSGTLFISRIYDLQVSQDLLGQKGCRKEDIRTVISHPQALNQCSDYLSAHGLRSIEYTNTALSAIEVKNSNDRSLGCIASGLAAEIYGLDVLDRNINSSRNNTTRFAVFSKTLHQPDRQAKMGQHFILVFTVLNEAGALAKTLNIIGAHGYNMRNLRSRPMKGLMWNYYFFLELEGNVNTPDGRDMLNELRSICDRLKLAGTYYQG